MTIQNEAIARLWRTEKEAWDSRDIDGIIKAIKGSCGFGIRGRDWRDSSFNSEEFIRRTAGPWFAKMEYLRHTDMDLNTWSEDDIGLAWGFYTEEFKHVGEPPEKVRIRFTSTYKRIGKDWVLLMSHKDMQPFNEDGSYMKEFTRIQ